MIINWNIFKAKFNAREEKAFEDLSTLLFCAEFNNGNGVFCYKNQIGIEAEPIITQNGEAYGYQAKYYTTPLYKNKSGIIESIQRAKHKNHNLHKLVLYTNKKFAESSLPDKKKPAYQIAIEDTAQQLGLEIIWRERSLIDAQLVNPKNKYIHDIFFGDNGLDQDFFVNQVEKEIKNLGPRFNEKLNFELPIAKVFNCISKNYTYRQNVVAVINDWLAGLRYGKLKDDTSLLEIETELQALWQELKDWATEFQERGLVEQNLSLSSLIEKIVTFDKKVACKDEELSNVSMESRKQCRSYSNQYDAELHRLQKIQGFNYELVDDINKLNLNLANYPTLIIQGEAGCGKSHLLGDIATRRKNQLLPTILLLGTSFNNATIEHNILEKLDLTCTFREFLEKLNSIGLLINSRVLILIDAINEGAGADLWKNQIAGFVSEVAKYPAVGLVLSIRSTYFDDIIPDAFKSNPDITIITHDGFSGNVYDALMLFCERYGLKQPDFPILNPEFANPLFLHTICEVAKDSPNKNFPKGFSGISKIYNAYKDALDDKFGGKMHVYKNRKIVSRAIEKLSVALFNAEYGQLEIQSAFKLFDEEFNQFPDLLSDLIDECVLMKFCNGRSRENHNDVVFFSYQKLGDFFMVEELLRRYKTEKELRNAFVHDGALQKIAKDEVLICSGIIEALSIVLPEKYGLELFELADIFIDENNDSHHDSDSVYREFIVELLESLKWRKIDSINDTKIVNWLNEHQRNFHCYEWFYTLTELSAIPNHPFNGDRLHKILIHSSMSERDSFWQECMQRCSDDNEGIANPLQRLIDWAWSPNISFSVDFETARLVAQTLAWVLSSTDIALRDKTTKALVNLLEQQPGVLTQTLKAFETVDDLYILERLYAVAYGCILRTEEDSSIRLIATYIYDAIFKDGNPPTHILLRDYARNAIEYAMYKDVGLDIDIDLVRPPYNSKMPALPRTDDDVKKYELDRNSPSLKPDFVHEHNVIYYTLNSLSDFGRYVCNPLISHFATISFKKRSRNKKEILDALSVRRWMVLRVFELGYDRELHGEYDRFASCYYGNNRHENQIERIGKKYQWIALYEILAMLTDNYKIKTDWGDSAKDSIYNGAWQLYIRNIDPAYITKNRDEENAAEQKVKDWWADEEYVQWNRPNSEWINMTDDLIDPIHIIEKKPATGENWLHLQHYVKWNEPQKIGDGRHSFSKNSIRYIIQGLLVKKPDKREIINYFKAKNLRDKRLPENSDSCSYIINREKFWSPAYIDMYNDDIGYWETIQDTKYKVIVATEPANGGIEKDKSGANRLYNIPCKRIFEGMNLQYASVDGNLRTSSGDIAVINSNPYSVLIRKNDLIQFLEDNNLDIVWTIIGEKACLTHLNDSCVKVLCGVYFLEDGILSGELDVFDEP